ncbi:flagellar motor switch protein FliM [Planosporangium sp. 12N6]|uniref:flagellar motor switch protein FliM n=1 Tax=Planosporangium spinosum TaxID=3402278 RepID=UPI003CEF20C1
MTQAPSMAGPSRTAGRINRRAKSAGPEPYDFRRPRNLSREHVRTLQIAYETFARQFTTILTTSLRAVSQVTLVSIEQFSYDEYISSLESPTIVAKVSMEPLPGTALVEFSLAIAMASIDHMLGGSGGAQPQRPLTDIETPLLQNLLDRVLGELRYAFEGIASIKPQLAGIEYNPQFVQAGGASDPVIVASFEMRVGAEECVATICLPFGMIFSQLQGDRTDVRLSPAQRAARDAAHHNLVAGMESVPLDVAVRFAPMRMRPEDLINLRPGDVVTLNHPTTQPLAVTTAGLTFAHAVPGSQGSRLACLIVAPAKEEDR